MRFFLLMACFVVMSSAVYAQDNITAAPICGKLVNVSEYTVRGSIATDRTVYNDPNDPVRDGTMSRHQSNFVLKPGEKFDVCSTGPFYPGMKLELMLRTLVPVFTCKTALGGDILIKGEYGEDGQYKSWAECL